MGHERLLYAPRQADSQCRLQIVVSAPRCPWGKSANRTPNRVPPTEHPNSHAEGAPFEHYGPSQRGGAIRYTR